MLAKQIATIDHLINGRIAVNIVSGWFRGEFQVIGEPWLEHDEPYPVSVFFKPAGAWLGQNDFFRPIF